MDSPGSRPGGRARVAQLAEGLVLYSRARSSWRSVHSSESNKLPANREQRDVRKGSEPTGAGTVPQVLEKGAATIPEEARKEPA